MSLYAQLLWSQQCRQRGGCAGCCTKATQRRACFKGHCGGGETVETCGRGHYNLRGGILAVVKIHSSRHVCVMLIGIVVSAIVFHPTQHCILKVGKFTRACPCRAFLQSLLSCLVHPYLLRNLFQLLFYSFRQVRFWAWIGATKMDPLGGTPSETDRWMKIISTGPCLRLRTNLEPRIAFWGPDLGYILVPVSGSIFGHRFGSRFGPLQLQTKSRAPKPHPKMEPKTRTKIWPKSGPKMQSRAPNLYGAQTRTCRDDLHSAVGLLGDLIQLCNKPTTSTKEGRETWAGKIAQTKSMNTFADQTYLEGTPNGHHILPPFQPLKLAPLIVTFASTNTPATFIQRRPAHAKPDFHWLSGPRNGTWKCTCGISCLRSLAPMRRLQCSTTQATFTNPSLLRATPLLRGMF